MAKKVFLALFFAALAAGWAGAEENSDARPITHKHNQFDLLLGFDLGIGVTTNYGDLSENVRTVEVSGYGPIKVFPKGNYAFIVDIGMNLDFYLFNWLSFNTGLYLHPDLYYISDKNSIAANLRDIMWAPICLTIPIAAHINVPKAEWLYAGMGLTINIPIIEMPGGIIGIDRKGKSFIGMPIDIGFDFTKPNGDGSRLFFRFTKEFHEGGTVVPVGIIWQFQNWQLNRK
jgi:hypothetical protein